MDELFQQYVQVHRINKTNYYFKAQEKTVTAASKLNVADVEKLFTDAENLKTITF